MLGLSIVAGAVVLQRLRSTPRPEAPVARAEQSASPSSGPAKDVAGPKPETQLQPVVRPTRRQVAEFQPAPKVQARPELLPPPRSVVVRIVLGPAEEPQQNDSMQRRNRATEAELRRQLAGAQTVGVGRSGSKIYTQYVARVKRSDIGPKGLADNTVLRTLRPDLLTLPLRDGPSVMLGTKAANELGVLSRKLHLYLDTAAPAGPNGRPMEVLRELLSKSLRGKKPEWLRAEAVPTLTQMLMAEDAATRRLLVDLLAAIPQKPATVALAQRAVFDLDADVRAAAVAALKGRDPELWRPVMVKGLNYPWAPPADFAAEALVQLQDKGAVAELVTMLREPQPGRPFVTRDRRVVIREVVKIHHQHNCVLCHAPAIGNEPVTGLDPVPVTWREYVSPSTAQTGAQKKGWGGPRIATTRTSLARVRADITFLRQDFSLNFPIANGLPQTALPRFDYVVRTRPVQKGERKKWQDLEDKSNPQRDAILFALRELTGQDHGDTTEAWVKAFPTAEAEVRSVKLADRVLGAEPLTRAALFQQYRDGVGDEYTWALARLIGRLSGPAQETARLTLVNRFGREPIASLRKHLRDRDPEVRRAAVRAAGQKNDKGLATDLVGLLDSDPTTAHLARQTLKKLTGQDLSDADAWRKWCAGLARADD
jgi:hypothetical protein